MKPRQPLVNLLQQQYKITNTVAEAMAKHTKTKSNSNFNATKNNNKVQKNPFSSLATKKTTSNKPPKIKNKPKPKKNKQNPNNAQQLEQKNDKSKKRDDAVLAPSGGGPTASASASASASEQLSFFIRQYQSSNKIKLSSQELESLTEKCMLELNQDPAQNKGNLGEYLKPAFGKSWREVLGEKQVQESKVEPGNPALLVVSSSAIRSLELLRELRPLTLECKPAKLFAKHMKVDEQVSFLKNRVNVASGTPSRIKKLIDMKALGLSRLSVVVIDLHTDVKGYSLLSLPQLRDEFWDLYRSHFHQRVLDGDMRICFYSQVPNVEKNTDDEE